MWQAPNQKKGGAGTKRSSDRWQRPMHIKRITVELRKSPTEGVPAMGPELVQARLVLNDLSPSGIGVFCAEAMAPGQEVALMLSTPATIYLRGRVVYCQEHFSPSHVISETPFGFRAGIQFTFQSADEQAAVTKFCEQLLASLNGAA